MDDVRPLDQRERPLNIRKGMRKGKTKGHDVWKVLKLPLWDNPFDQYVDPDDIDPDDIDPAYIKKHRSEMK